MIRRSDLGLALTGLMCLMTGCGETSPIERALANGPGPVDADAPDEFTTTDSGLKYRILRKGDGDRPTARDGVTVNYAGWLDNGQEFDTSYKQVQPVTYSLNRVVRGWSEGLQFVAKGGMIELEVPSDLGYGAGGQSPSIPPNSTLHFLVELIDIQPGPEPIEPGPIDPDAPEEFTTTESGLRYRIRRPGREPKVTDSDVVTIHYRASFMTGTAFDGTYFSGKPAVLGVSNIIPGWREGLKLIGVGGMIELEIPSNLAYGAEGQPPRIPPDSDLHFIVELLDIKPL